MANERNQVPTFTNRTLDKFKSIMRGGGARPNLFECDIVIPSTLIPSDTVQENLKMMVKSAALPGSTMDVVRVPYRGRTLKLPGDRSFESWTVTVVNDTSFDIRDIFERWSNIMNRYEDNAGIIDPNVYMKDITVMQLGRGRQPGTTTDQAEKIISKSSDVPVHKRYKLVSAFPTNIGDIALSYDTISTVEEFSVTFEYQWFESQDARGNSIFAVDDAS